MKMNFSGYCYRIVWGDLGMVNERSKHCEGYFVVVKFWNIIGKNLLPLAKNLFNKF